MSRAERIRAALESGLSPTHLDVIDESHMHAVPKGAESHFKLVVAAPGFAGKSRVERHRSINALLKEELASGLHAVALSLFTPSEWAATGVAPDSPECRGGSKAENGEQPEGRALGVRTNTA